MFRAIFWLNIRSLLTAFTASGIIHVCRCWLMSRLSRKWLRSVPTQPTQSWKSSNSSMIGAAGSNGVTNTRCCRYSYMCSWWWVEVPPETCKAVFKYDKLCNVASCWIYIGIFLRCTDPWMLNFQQSDIFYQPIFETFIPLDTILQTLIKFLQMTGTRSTYRKCCRINCIWCDLLCFWYECLTFITISSFPCYSSQERTQLLHANSRILKGETLNPASPNF
jgi:hypothetical protein